MKVLARNIPLTLNGVSYLADIILGIYRTTGRPAILLADSRPDSLSPQAIWDGSPIGVASSNAPEEYIQHLTKPHFPAKCWSENKGLWEQLLPLNDEDGFPLFVQTRHAITLGFATAPIMLLGPNACIEFSILQDEMEHDPRKEARHG
jgi:hypothetical protein